VKSNLLEIYIQLNLEQKVLERCLGEFDYKIVETNNLRPLTSGKYAVVRRTFEL